MLRKVIIGVLLALNFYGFSQAPLKIIDSLKQVVLSNPSDSLKIKIYSDLCWYYRNVSRDSAFVYGNMALKLSQQTNNQLGEAQAYNDIGILHYDLAEYSKSMSYYKRSLQIRNKLKDTMGVAALYNKLGLVHQNMFKMDSAIFYATKALKIYDEKNRTRYVAVIKNNIANIYKGLRQYKKALNAHIEIAEINKANNDQKALTRSYNNIANAYILLKDTTKSIEFYEKSISLAETHNYKKELAALYNNYGGILQGRGEYQKAIDYINKSLALRKELNDNYGIASSSLHLGGLYLDLKDIQNAKNHLYLGLALSERALINELRLDAYDKLASYYAYRKNADSVIHYKELFRVLKDTIFSKQVIEEVAEVQEKYNASEREKEIFEQRADLAEKELAISEKNTQLIGLCALILVIAILGYLLVNQQKLKNRQIQKENELQNALTQIETQNKLQQQRLRISRDLHDNIGSQLTFIISSIDNLQYGSKIKNDKLTNKLKSISQFTKDTIYELRDTIWAMNKSKISLEDLQARISNFIDKAEETSQHIDFSFNIDETLSKDVDFTSVKGMNIYRIIQEATNNAVKYAEASEIKIFIKEQSEGIEISVSDNGNGFDVNHIAIGNGIHNMRKRASDINAVINIKSQINKGTNVMLLV